MTEFLYTFGYHSPDDRTAVEAGADQESFGFFRVSAESEAEALEWGHELSRWYTSYLYGNDGRKHWDTAWFASSIERDPDELLKEAALTVPVAAPGEYPDPEQIKAAFYD